MSSSLKSLNKFVKFWIHHVHDTVCHSSSGMLKISSNFIGSMGTTLDLRFDSPSPVFLAVVFPPFFEGELWRQQLYVLKRFRFNGLICVEENDFTLVYSFMAPSKKNDANSKYSPSKESCKTYCDRNYARIQQRYPFLSKQQVRTKLKLQWKKIQLQNNDGQYLIPAKNGIFTF